MLVVSVDGVDCMGKSTYCNDLKNSLESKGEKVALVHFPRYDGPYGKGIKEELYKCNKDNELLQILCINDFLSFTREISNGAYIDYDYIILDRSYISTLAYNKGAISDLEYRVRDFIENNKLIRIDCSIVMKFTDKYDEQIVRQRLEKKENKDSNENIEYLLEVDKEFEKIINNERLLPYLNISKRGSYNEIKQHDEQ